MEDTALQIILLFVGGFIFLIVWAARAFNRQIDRQLSRMGDGGGATAGRSASASLTPGARKPTNSMTVISGPNTKAKQSPFDKYMAECVRTDCPPSTEYFSLQEKWQRQGWQVPSFMEAFDMYQAKRNGDWDENGNEELDEATPNVSIAPVPIQQPIKTKSESREPKATNPVSDMRQNTLDAMAQLPKTLPLTPQSQVGTIPLLFDGSDWHYLNLGQDGHWGFFGTSGSGKGNALQQVVNHVLACGPERVELYVLDPKGGLDYIFCEKLAHAKLYYGPRLTDGCVDIVAEMNRRLDLLREAEARNLPEYETITKRKLPWMVVVADEIAELDEAQRSFIETFARMSRAAGGVLLVATQYPTTDVLSSQIQANVTNRMVFRLVSSDYVWVALRRRKNDPGMYDPSAISKKLPGVAVWRSDGGNEILGRSPEITDMVRQDWIRYLVQCWPRPAVSQEPFPTRILDFERGNTGNRETGNRETAVEDPTELEERTIRTLNASGMPRREIAKVLKGRTQDRMEQIRKVLDGDAV